MKEADKKSLVRILNITAGVLKSEKSDHVENLNSAAQSLLREGPVKAFEELLNRLESSGKITEKTTKTSEYKVSAARVLNQLNDPDFDVERFNIARDIFLGSATKGVETLINPTAIELMNICGKLTAPSIHVFRAAVEVQEMIEASFDELVDHNLVHHHGLIRISDWLDEIRKISQVTHDKILNPAVDLLVDKGLLERGSATKDTTTWHGIRLSNMGREVAELLVAAN